MKQLWSPWRMKYILSHKNYKGCIFCKALEQENHDKDNLIVYRGQFAFVILNLYPYSSGHLMVVPNAHLPRLDLLESQARIELIELMSRAEHVLRQVYNPDGLNIGANVGAAAGAGVEGHLHFHLVPRWAGDSNFMSVVGHVRVLPEELWQTHQKLHEAWNKP